MQTVTQFYDDLAQDYQFIFADWHQSVLRQGKVLHALLQNLGINSQAHILDCTCGIGTQAIGLATQEYRVHGTDLSPKAIQQAQQNAMQFEISISPIFAVDNLLQPKVTTEKYDVVLAMDNAFAHFLTAEEFQIALQTMLSKLNPNGLIMLSLRDYDATSPEKSQTPSSLTVTDTDKGRRIVFQLWDWSEDGTQYELQKFVLREDSSNWETLCHTTTLRAWHRAEISAILEQLPLENIQWHLPTDSGFYQPIVTAMMPS